MPGKSQLWGPDCKKAMGISCTLKVQDGKRGLIFKEAQLRACDDTIAPEKERRVIPF